jgi:hypothetical protein
MHDLQPARFFVFLFDKLLSAVPAYQPILPVCRQGPQEIEPEVDLLLAAVFVELRNFGR